MRLVFKLVFIAILSGSAINSQELIPIGNQFQVNSYTTHGQFSPTISSDDRGRFVVVWQTSHTSYEGEIKGQLFHSDGSRIHGEFRVNSSTIGKQEHPTVYHLKNSDFIIAWTQNSNILAQRFGSEGQSIGSEIQINAHSSHTARYPSIGSVLNEEFIVVWDHDPGGHWNDTTIQAQRFSSDGIKIAEEFQVNTYTTKGKHRPAISLDGSDGFVVVWESFGSYGNDNSNTSIQARLFNSLGSPRGNQFQVNTTSAGYQLYPAVISDLSEGFVIVWNTWDEWGTPRNVFGQRFLSDGNSVGSEIRVYQETNNVSVFGNHPSVIPDHKGGFVVSWFDFYQAPGGSDNSGTGILALRFSSLGDTLGAIFQINSFTTDAQYHPVIASNGKRKFVFAWLSYAATEDEDSSSIHAQRLTLPDLFADGFESGDPSAWTEIQPQ